MPTKKPHTVVIRSYQVGFGDCFLLSFRYDTIERHLLIDFGTTARPKNAPKDQMKRVAEDIREATKGKLTAVVATHRHRDHISGFAGSSGKIIADLDPNVVLQPWTEHPDAEIDALAAPRIEERNLTVLHTLANMDRIAAQAEQVAKQFRRHDAALAERLGFLGEDNVKNKESVEALMKMGGRRRYLWEGRSAGLTRLLPGVKVHVLGPPNLKQTEAIRQQTSTHDDEFWHMQARAGDFALDDRLPLFPGAATGRPPGYARWFSRRTKDVRLEQMLELVLALDDALNNTSLILLFETRGHYFLFPGDAQWENWQHALSKTKYENLLKKVNVYKVGHHGSLNATPKSLWRLFEHRDTQASAPDRLTTMMSTLEGKHGKPHRNTEVPRTTLVEALKRETDHTDTQDLASDELAHELVYPLV